MPPSILPPNQSKSSWWSRAKSGKEPTIRPMRSFSGLKDDSEKSMLPVPAKSRDPSSSKLKTLGSAMSFKSKKAPSLAIQDLLSDVPIQAPPPPTPPADFAADQTTVVHSTIHSSHNKLHGIKSIRTARSTEADTDAKSIHTASEPRTPSDYRTSYQPSVLTSFSEIDPFASGGVIVQQNNDPNRLSTYSDSSMLEPSKQRGEILFYNRISYASTSSKSQGHSSDSHSMKPASPRSSRLSRGESSRQNASGYVKDSSLGPPVPPLTDSRRQSPSGSSGSTVRMGEGSRLSEPPPGKPSFQRTSLPFASRSRGMTIGAPEGRPSTANPSGLSAVPSRFRKMSDLPPASPKAFYSSPSTPSSSSPVAFGRPRSSTVNSAESFESPNMSPSSIARPLVVVRKASSTRVNLPPLSRAPSQDLPPTPFPESIHGALDSLDDLSIYPDADIPSSSSSSLSFAPSMDFDMDATGDMINQLMLHSLDDQVGSRSKGKGCARRRTAMSTSPDTLRDFEFVQPGPSSSTSRLPSTGGSGDGSGDYSSGRYSMSMRSLKRASSQQSLHSLLAKRFSGASISSITSGSVNHEDALLAKNMSSGTKPPRKQHSFHHARLPLPPLPALRHATSDVAPPGSPVCPPIEQRKSSGSMHTPARKRLFPGGSSSRRSTSSHGQGAMSGDEDNRSLYSVDEQLRAAGQKIVMSFGSFTNPLSLLTNNSSVPGSYLPDATGTGSTTSLPPEPQTPTGADSSWRASQAEYIPKQIMSPAEMLKLEQQLAREAADREDHGGEAGGRRGQATEAQEPVSAGKRQASSIVSPATSAFGYDDPVHRRDSKTPVSSPQLKPAALSSPSMRVPSRLPFRSHSTHVQLPRKPSLTIRPSTATLAQQSPVASVAASSESPQQATWSLPPPPRARPSPSGPVKKGGNEKRISTAPLQPLSPPPARLRERVSSLQGSSSQVPVKVMHRPAQSTVTRPPSAFDQKAMQRKSLMKKPSFLDIEDEADVTSDSLMDVNLDALDSPAMDSSFLDMERGKDSFDTVRSSDSLIYV